MERLILAPEHRRQTILDLLRSTRRSILLSLFRCDDSRVLDEIVATVRRNVEVRILVTPRARGWNKRLGSLVMLLKDTGVDVRQYDGPWAKYHAKYIVVDGESAAVASLNLTRKCFDETCDFILMSGDPELVSSLTALFDFDANTPHLDAPALSDRLIVAPDQSLNRTLRLLDQARHRIRIIDHRVSHPEILLLIARKLQDGVSVRILGRGQVGQFASHGKLILIDDDLAMIGSASLSRQGLDVRREVSVIIDDPAIIAELAEFFDRIAAAPVTTDAVVDEDDDED